MAATTWSSSPVSQPAGLLIEASLGFFTERRETFSPALFDIVTCFRHHNVDIDIHFGGLRARRVIVLGDDEFGELVENAHLRSREKLRLIRGGRRRDGNESLLGCGLGQEARRDKFQ